MATDRPNSFENYVAACTCDPEAFEVGPEGQRRYFEDRYCPTHGEEALPGGTYICPMCAAVVAWEGELPDNCLRCGASPVERVLAVVRSSDEALFDKCIDALGWHESAKIGVDPDV